MKKALVVVLALCAVAWAAFAGPTTSLESIWYGDQWQMAWGAGISYVSDESWGGFAEFKFCALDYASGDEWHLMLTGLPDVQLTYDVPLYAVQGESVLILRPGVGMILPFYLGVADKTFCCAINDPGLAISMALVVPYDITLRGELFINSVGASWGLGVTVDWFGLAKLFRSDTFAGQ